MPPSNTPTGYLVAGLAARVLDARRLRRTRAHRLEAINELVQDLAYAAGLAVRPTRIRGQCVYHQWGAHGLRAGFITEGLREGKLTIEEVRGISGHKCLEVLLGYRREVKRGRTTPRASCSTRDAAELHPGLSGDGSAGYSS